MSGIHSAYCASSAEMTYMSSACLLNSKYAEITVTEVSVEIGLRDLQIAFKRVDLPVLVLTSEISSFMEK